MKQRRYLYLFSKVCFYFIPYKYFHVYFLIWHYYKTPLGHCCFTIKLHSISDSDKLAVMAKKQAQPNQSEKLQSRQLIQLHLYFC